MVKNEKIISKIICIGIGLALGIIAIEMILRLLGFGYNLIYRLPKDRGVDYRIFCIGESTTFGIGSSNPMLQNYPHQLEKMLNNKFQNLKIQCFFDQSIGGNTSKILIKLPLYLKEYQPNLIIFMVGVNNWWNLDKSNILLFNKNNFISEFTLKTSVILDQFRAWKLFKWIAYSKGLIKYSSDIVFPPEYNEEDVKKRCKEADKLVKLIREKYGVEIFAKIAEYDIREMIKICNNHRIKIIMCSYPMDTLPNQLYYVQIKIAKELSIPFVDNKLLFRRLPNINEYLSSDGWHPNDKGYKLVAENIYNCILDNKLIQ